jgi:hypothetical protein
MSARSLLVLLLVLAAAAPVHAAPAPFHRPEAAHPEVVLRGWIGDDVAARAPSFVTRQSDYESVARAFGIADPPRVDFRTHFLFVHVGRYAGAAEPRIDAGDLRAAAAVVPAAPVAKCKDVACGTVPAGSAYLIKAYRRSAVRTVNGVAVPKN